MFLELYHYFHIQPGLLVYPDISVGGKIISMHMHNASWQWVLIPSKYVHLGANNDIKYCEGDLGVLYNLPKKAYNPIVTG